MLQLTKGQCNFKHRALNPSLGKGARGARHRPGTLHQVRGDEGWGGASGSERRAPRQVPGEAVAWRGGGATRGNLPAGPGHVTRRGGGEGRAPPRAHARGCRR